VDYQGCRTGIGFLMMTKPDLSSSATRRGDDLCRELGACARANADPLVSANERVISTSRALAGGESSDQTFFTLPVGDFKYCAVQMHCEVPAWVNKRPARSEGPGGGQKKRA
jgi:hypothetical protein